ncbi:hypothetical protein DSO57_1037194 [Entomophthora muscae]|uniref:Uncharacterized protein n=1 Tax=Entomophthora muscae TaxID=34485 RepID=A0ACC2RE53_9FUNG|nr:hypothetical protein DSO57_1037194 [Entomophthora muscae]
MLPMAQFAYNSKDYISTGMSLFKANYGFDPTWDYKIGKKKTNTTGRSWVEQIHNTQKTCLTNLNCTVKTYKAFANQKQTPGQLLQVGDEVYLDSSNVLLHIVMVDSIMPGIFCPSKKARKAGKPVSKLTKLTDLSQTVD